MKKIFGFWIFLNIIIGIESVKQQYHRATAEQFITAKHLEQYHSQSMEQQNRYNSYYSYNTYSVNQSNRITDNHLERYHSKTAITD